MTIAPIDISADELAIVLAILVILVIVPLQQQIEQPASIHKPGHQGSPHMVVPLLVQQEHAGGNAASEASSWDCSCARQQGVHVDLLHTCSAG